MPTNTRGSRPYAQLDEWLNRLYTDLPDAPLTGRVEYLPDLRAGGCTVPSVARGMPIVVSGTER